MAHKLPRGLYALLDDSLYPTNELVEVAGAFARAQVPTLQVRLKRTAGQAAIELCQAIVSVTRGTQSRVIIDDRPDWALLSYADGVHLGADDVQPAIARRALGPDALIGVTVRNRADIGRAFQTGADYVGLGPVFASTTKPTPFEPLGVAGFAREAKGSPVPVVAIGGIGLESASALARAGAWGLAVGSALAGPGGLTRANALMAAFSL